MKPWKIIQKLESDNSRLFKESIIEENINDLEFQEGLSMCLDALVTFGVKQVPKSDKNGSGLGWSCLLYTSPSPRDGLLSRMPSSA